MLVVLALVGCVVGGGDGSWGFEAATAIDVELSSGEVHIRPSHDAMTHISYEGGGFGRSAHPDVFQADDGAVFVDARGAIGGGEFRIEVPEGTPITAIIDRGELDIELDAPADIDACVAAGEVSIGVPPGAYDIELEAGVGRIAVELVDQDGAEHFIRACTGAGEIDLHVTDEDAISD